MIQKLSIATVYVLDQERAKRFYTEKLGFEVHTDVTMKTPVFEGEDADKKLPFRWLTVRPKGQPDLEISLMSCAAGAMLTAERAAALRSLIEAGTFGFGAFRTDDCRATYAELVARGVEFMGPPQERPYGIEAVLKDDSGNYFALVQEL